MVPGPLGHDVVVVESGTQLHADGIDAGLQPVGDVVAAVEHRAVVMCVAGVQHLMGRQNGAIDLHARVGQSADVQASARGRLRQFKGAAQQGRRTRLPAGPAGAQHIVDQTIEACDAQCARHADRAAKLPGEHVDYAGQWIVDRPRVAPGWAGNPVRLPLIRLSECQLEPCRLRPSALRPAIVPDANTPDDRLVSKQRLPGINHRARPLIDPTGRPKIGLAGLQGSDGGRDLQLVTCLQHTASRRFEPPTQPRLGGLDAQRLGHGIGDQVDNTNLRHRQRRHRHHRDKQQRPHAS